MLLVVPNDEGVLHFPERGDGVPLVSRPQIYLDVLGLPRRVLHSGSDLPAARDTWCQAGEGQAVWQVVDLSPMRAAQ